MKALDDALAAPSLADALEILKSLDKADHSNLLDHLNPASSELIDQHNALLLEARKAGADELKRKLEIFSVARIVGHSSRKTVPAKFPVGDDTLIQPEVLDFLMTTKPAWFQKFIEKRVATVSEWESCFDFVRTYIDAGVIPPPPADHRYYADISGGILCRHGRRVDDAKQGLINNPQLITHDLVIGIQRLGQKDGHRWDQATPISPIFFTDQDEQEKISLLSLVSELCKAGHFDLQVILQTTTDALMDCQRELEARDLIDAHDQLDPGRDLQLANQQLYHGLLASPHKAVVRFAIKQLADLADQQGYDARELMEQAPTALQQPSNPLLLELLALFEKALSHHSKAIDQLDQVIPHVLMVQNAKVQKALLPLLKLIPESQKEPFCDSLQPYADQILPALRKQFEPWIKKKEESTSEPVASPPPGSIPIGQPLEPLKSVDDLAFVANELIDRDLDPMKLELFLDGVSRYAANHLEQLVKDFAPLQKRALKFDQAVNEDGSFYPSSLLFVCHFVIAFGTDPDEFRGWIPDPDLPADTPAKTGYYGERKFLAAMNFAGARLGELLSFVRKGGSAPLLSTPEFSLGFISPSTLLKRLEKRIEDGDPILHYDFIQAIARCHIDASDQKNPSLPDGKDEASRVLRFLLGGTIDGEITTPAWWLAAARTRDPLGDFSKDPAFASHDTEDMPDWVKPARYRELPLESYRWGDLENPLQPQLARSIPPDHIYPLQHGEILPDTYGRWGSDLRWRYSFTPSALDAVVAQDIQFTTFGASLTERTAINASAAIVQELGARHLPLRFTMQLHLLALLTSPGKAEREAGVDLFIQASNDGRLEPALPGLGRLFSSLMDAATPEEMPFTLLSRLVPCLREISNQGPLLQRQVRDILLVGLNRPFERPPKGFPSLLELLLDLLVNSPPPESLDLNSIWNGRLKGKAKTIANKIAKTSCAKKPS
ncbi:DUF6493 family protein [Haloferula chungangensis]|uniref:DUF6493 family protein n=1 Tax=Haloferula chungangensis TaxID=1048331 RepID=A0ABW2L821_9BACT